MYVQGCRDCEGSLEILRNETGAIQGEQGGVVRSCHPRSRKNPTALGHCCREEGAREARARWVSAKGGRMQGPSCSNHLYLVEAEQVVTSWKGSRQGFWRGP